MVQKRKKTRTHVRAVPEHQIGGAKVPKSFIIRTGSEVGKSVGQLVMDMRNVMEPNTASRLKERRSNKLRDFLAMAGPLGVTHLLAFSRGEFGPNLRIVRFPRGPTLTFRVVRYALARDVVRSMRRPRSPGNEFLAPPLLVLNNFNLQNPARSDGAAEAESRNLRLVATTFQNLFPSIDVQNMHLSHARRVVILDYDSTSKYIDMRHYLILVRPVGISKPVRKILEGGRRKDNGLSTRSRSSSRSIPDMSPNQDVSQYILHPNSDGDTSASEGESEYEQANGISSSTVSLGADFVGRNNKKSEQRAIKLVELGPRLQLQLIKIEAGICTGQVLHHEFVKKTKAEADDLEASHIARQKLKEQRKAEQALNVRRKKGTKAVDSPPSQEHQDVESDFGNDDDGDDVDPEMDLDDVAALGYSEAEMQEDSEEN